MENFRRYVIKISSVIYLPTSSPTEYIRRLSFPHYICRKNKKKHLPMILQTEIAR